MVIITRKYSDLETFGDLVAHRNGKIFKCKTLELPWINNAKNISCVPKGIYNVKQNFWSKKLKSYYLLQNVPSRNGIYMHEGNYAFKKKGIPDIQGCILLGLSYADLDADQTLDITTSKITVAAFEKFMNREPFELLIR